MITHLKVNRGSQDLFGGPSLPNPGIDDVSGYSRFFGPVSSAHRPVLVREQLIVPLVAELLFTGSPATITRLIVAVIVDAINGVGRPRLWPHVC